jgi:hypothetical protein
MMATHELVVPRSMPITSPASADDDCHRSANEATAGCWAANLEENEGIVVVADRNDDDELLPANSKRLPRFSADEEKPLRIPSCNAIVNTILLMLFLFCVDEWLLVVWISAVWQ